jgi:cytochrome P450
LHDVYGPVVRLAPDELSFIDAAAWRDIYSGQQSNKGFPKNNVIAGAQGFYSLTDACDADHSRFRGTIQKLFSAQAIQARESTFQTYVGLLVARLQEAVEAAGTGTETVDASSEKGSPLAVVNIVEYLNWTTFDITGELTFSESFGCLSDQITDPWIALIFAHLKASALMIGLRFYHPLDEYLMWLIPARLAKKKQEYIQLSKAKVHRRIALETKAKGDGGRQPDFMTPALESQGRDDGMTLEEIEGTFTTLIIGGSETTATTIAGIVNYLLANRDKYDKLVREIRAVEAEEALSIAAVSHLPYLNGVIQEGLRLCTPLPAGLTRIIPPEGASVSGHWVPGGVSSPSRLPPQSTIHR